MNEYDIILKLCTEAIDSDDETARELVSDLADAAYRYTGYRLQFNFYDREKKADEDKARSACHDRYMDCLIIFLRYEAKLGKEVPDVKDFDRKTLGDYGNRLVADLAIRQR